MFGQPSRPGAPPRQPQSAASLADELEAFVLEKIRAGAPVPGTYPPNEQTRVEYEAWRKARR